ncbi:hypothetical protein OAS86_01320 [Gammaproteobacteria bacterium]|nr:hypothetical protein [Gammaproteobacteria bacterium]
MFDFSVVLPDSIDQAIQLVMLFVFGYWIAFVFKNMGNLLADKGIIVFIVLMCFFVAVLMVIPPTVEAAKDFTVTGAYSLGFLLRFFRHDR